MHHRNQITTRTASSPFDLGGLHQTVQSLQIPGRDLALEPTHHSFPSCSDRLRRLLYGFEPQMRCPITPPLEKCLSTVSLLLLKQLLKDQPHLVSASRLQETSRQSGKLLLDFEHRSQPQVPFPFNCLCSRDSCRRTSSTASPISFIR